MNSTLSQVHFLKQPKVIDKVYDLGDICVPAHPFRGGDSVRDWIYNQSDFDALETHNGGNVPSQYRLAVDAAGKFWLLSIGGSDCHIPEPAGYCETVFANPISDMDDLVREIIAG